METGKNATAFAWANNSDLLRSLKHLLETRLKSVDSDWLKPSIFKNNQSSADLLHQRKKINIISNEHTTSTTYQISFVSASWIWFVASHAKSDETGMHKCINCEKRTTPSKFWHISSQSNICSLKKTQLLKKIWYPKSTYHEGNISITFKQWYYT